ncbi:MAG TPA: cupredoxin domain-containing protein [Dehalococcoidales bacterium]|nr:cupredoxin domain-containing protein [Dehalococcoidales bacterium]
MLTITEPSANIHQIGNVTVSVQVSNFNLIDKLGQANVPGQGHLHYFMDVDAPTTPGQPAITTPGTYAATAATSYTWTNVGGGSHKFSVELINNDHTPLVPPVVATVTVLVTPEIGPPAMVILSPRDGSNVPAGNVPVTIQVSNFNIVDKQGQANAPFEGHVHYYLDVAAPTTPNQPAIPGNGVWAHVASANFTFSNVAPGSHTISVQLVNNDHTPLIPLVISTIKVNVQPAATTTTPPPTTTTTSTAPTTTTTTASPAPTTTTTAATVSIDLVAKNIAFDKSTITVPAGAKVTVNFDNQDAGVPHNFSVYTNSSASTPIFQGQIITGPLKTTYQFTAPSQPGTYFFRCDVHPTQMTGSFIVQ